MPFVEAKDIDIATAPDDILVAAWHSHASYISYLEADDHGRDWVLAPPIRDNARLIETEIHKRGLERPTGTYLMSIGDRIDWETGTWSPGWNYKKAAA